MVVSLLALGIKTVPYQQDSFDPALLDNPPATWIKMSLSWRAKKMIEQNDPAQGLVIFWGSVVLYKPSMARRTWNPTAMSSATPVPQSSSQTNDSPNANDASSAHISRLKRRIASLQEEAELRKENKPKKKS